MTKEMRMTKEIKTTMNLKIILKIEESKKTSKWGQAQRGRGRGLCIKNKNGHKDEGALKIWDDLKNHDYGRK